MFSESPRDASNKDSPASQADSGYYSVPGSNSPSKDGATSTSGTSPDSPNRDRMLNQNYTDPAAAAAAGTQPGFNRDMTCESI